MYVVRNKAYIPYVTEHRDPIPKIGVTNAKVESGIGNARLEPTFLMADVEIVAEYKLYNIDRGKLEKLIHRIFAAARLKIEIEDRFGNPVVPREWFLVPLGAINDAVEKNQRRHNCRVRLRRGENRSRGTTVMVAQVNYLIRSTEGRPEPIGSATEGDGCKTHRVECT